MGGPSLTRLLIVLPVYLMLAALGFAWLAERPALRRLVPIGLLVLALAEGFGYFSNGASAQAEYYAAAATPLAERATALAAQGHHVLCIVSKDANVARFLTHGHESNVRIAEFYMRPIRLADLPVLDFHPSDILIEDAPQFRPFLANLPDRLLTCREEKFVCFKN